MTKKEIERARHLFNLIGWWAKQGDGNERILEYAREGYYLLGGMRTPFPNNKELDQESHAGIICMAIICIIAAAIIWWQW